MNEPREEKSEGGETDGVPRMGGADLDDPNFNSNGLIKSDFPDPKLSPRDFELIVKQKLDAEGGILDNYQSNHREVLDGFDGSYEIDIVIRFGFSGLQYVTLVECKAYGSPVKREKVAELWAKVQSLGAHKGILYSTSGFQSGALEFAMKHGIALAHVADKMTSVLAKAKIDLMQNIVAAQRIDDVCGWLVQAESASLLFDMGGPNLFIPEKAKPSDSRVP